MALLKTIILLEARPQQNTGNTLGRVIMLFTRLGITPLKVNRFGWNLQHCEYIVGVWPWQIFGAIRAVARVKDDFYCQVINTGLHWLPVSKFHEICTQHIDWWSGEFFKNRML